MYRVGPILAMVACGGHEPRPKAEPFVVRDVFHPRHVPPEYGPDAPPSTPGVSTISGSSSKTAPPRATPPNPNRCDDLSVADMTIDGLLDDWHGVHVVTRAGTPGAGAVALRCVWDGESLALSLDVEDDHVV